MFKNSKSNNKKSINSMSFKTKGFEAKIGKTMITRRPYAKVTVSEDMIYLGAAMTVGVPLAVTGAKKLCKLGAAGVKKVSGIFKHEEEEDFMEQ